MANVKLFDQTGKEVSTVELNDAIFGIEPNESVVFDVVISQRASLRQGTHAVKNRSAVSGGGRKPWRQKGTEVPHRAYNFQTRTDIIQCCGDCCKVCNKIKIIQRDNKDRSC